MMSENRKFEKKMMAAIKEMISPQELKKFFKYYSEKEEPLLPENGEGPGSGRGEEESF
jgi:hypothetical protein